MRINLGQRLVPLSTLGVGGLAVAIVFAIALFAFETYVDHLRRDAAVVLDEAAATARTLPSGVGAVGAAHAMASRFFPPALLVTFVGRRSRITVLHEAAGSGTTGARILARARDDRRLPETTDFFARPTLGLATAFGLTTLHAHAGTLDITVDVNRVRLADDIRSFLPAFVAALALALGVAAVIARALTRGALRPLDDVTRALERFSAGDFTPEFIESDGNAQLGALALAYNGAVRQVERSFAERARAHAMMRQFVADGGHQLRTPLTVIRGFVGILRSSGSTMEPAEFDHVLAAMAEQATLMSTLIDTLILLDEMEADDASYAGVTDVARATREIVAPFALAHPERSLRIDAPRAELAAVDPADLRHTLGNIVDNALKYTAGTVDVVVRGAESGVSVSVSDEGPGMSAAHVDRAFDRFFRGKRRDVPGSGLGLAIAKRAAERSNGSLEVESTVERGTRFVLRLPRAADGDQPE